MPPKKKTTKQSQRTAKNVKAIVTAAKKYKPKKASAKVFKGAVTVVLILAVIVFGYFYDQETFTFSDFFENVYYSYISPPAAPAFSLQGEGETTIHFVDVGQGDSIIIELPDGKNMIVDGGPAKSRYALFAAIDALNIKKFDYVLLTHTDEDHCGGLAYLLEREGITFEKVYMPDIPTSVITTKIYKRFCDGVEKSGATAIYSTPITDIEGSGYLFDFITPQPTYYQTLKFNTAEKINAVSPIIVAFFGDRKLMLTGDANSLSEQWFAEEIAGLDQSYYDVDVLKVAHHGSKSSTTDAFLQVAKPEYAVISYGKGNTYGHPNEELLARLRWYMEDSQIYKTAESGTITLKILDSDENGEYELQFTAQNALATVSIKLQKISLAEIYIALRVKKNLFITQ